MKKVLITGVAGFIGSNLCEYLLNKNYKVIGLDNFCSSNKNNIKDFLKNKNFKFYKHDVRKKYDFKVDAIYNLACPASPVYYQKDSIYTFETCIQGAKNALDLATKYNIPVLQASTSEVYGDALDNPQKESYWGNVNCTGIRSCYDEGKRGAETLFFDYHRKFNTKIKVIRIFNTYGPRMMTTDGRVISNFILQALQNKDITVYGNGSQTRSFQYIDDLLEAMLKVINTDDNFIGPVNLGNPEEFTILDIAKKIINITDSKSKIVFKDLPKDDPKQRKPDITFAKEMLDWKPVVSIDRGLINTINYFKNN